MSNAWTCSECGHKNSGGAFCDLCGLALHYQLDPPLDLPRRPYLSVMPEFWMALVWLAAAVLSLALLLPWARDVLGFAPLYVALQTGAFLLTAAGSFIRALWKRDFQRLELIMPPHSESGRPLSAQVEVIPYTRIKGLHLKLELVERQMVRAGKSGHIIRSRRLATYEVLNGEALRGRRLHVIGTDFVTPLATGRYMSLVNEMNVSLAETLARFMPFVGMIAFNMQQDGGFYVLMKARVGPFRQLQIRRVVVYSNSGQVLVG